jgi:penicillin-binding protein 1A
MSKKRSFLFSLKRVLLQWDAAVDSGLYSLRQTIGSVFSTLQDFSLRLHARGIKRAILELTGEGLTLGSFGFLLMLALAIPAFEEVREDWRAKQDYSITILDRYGNEIGKRGILLNDSVPLSDIPDHMIKATLATEDRRFYHHFGIDIPGTFRALIENAKADGVVQGGSSITQQLAKNLFLTSERTLARKVKEAYLALWLEANYTKNEILKLYLDRAYMGGGAFGVVAAAEYYFEKDIRDITLAEAAMLAGLYKAPSKFSPLVDLAAARARANEVLYNMVEAGFLSEGQILAARQNPALPVNRQDDETPGFFLDWVFEQVKDIAPPGQKILTVRSTLDPAVQKRAENSIKSNLRQYGVEYNVRQAGAVLMEVEGAVRAMVGGRDYGESQFNRTTDALRQPGSSFKPFVYATAMLHGFTASTVISDAPICLGNWCPKNYNRSYAGPVTLTTALTRSINTIPVRLAQRLGRDKIIDTAYKMGINTELTITRSLPLGVAEVTVLDMASAYAVLGNGGYKATPYGILDIRDAQGSILYSRSREKSTPQRVLPDDAVVSMNQMMTNVVTSGTGRRAQLDNVTAAGKTGTTQSYRMHGSLDILVILQQLSGMAMMITAPQNRLTGGRLPAMSWHDIMTLAHQGILIRPMPGVEAPIDQKENQDMEDTPERRLEASMSTPHSRYFTRYCQSDAKKT